VKALCDALEIERPIVIGMSFGGYVAMCGLGSTTRLTNTGPKYQAQPRGRSRNLGTNRPPIAPSERARPARRAEQSGALSVGAHHHRVDQAQARKVRAFRFCDHRATSRNHEAPRGGP
jgi:pimeloyl-ACP methyl ester carboxylesterase